MKSRRANEHPARNYLAEIWNLIDREKGKPSVELMKSIQDGLEKAGSLIDQWSPIENEERRLLEALVQTAEIKTMPVGRGKVRAWIEVNDRENYDFIIKRLIELRSKK